MAPRAPSSLQAEIGQTRPFRSAAQEALLGIARTASVIDRLATRMLAPAGLSTAQYNVLRILRGAGPDGLPTLAIRCRMIDPAAAITRLVDKLEQAGWVARERMSDDRREVRCRITPAGLDLLDQLEPIVVSIDERVGELVSDEELDRLSATLERIRTHLG